MTRATHYVPCLTRRQLRMLLDAPEPEPPARRVSAVIRRRVLARLRAARPEPVYYAALTRDWGVLWGMACDGLIECLDHDYFRLPQGGRA